MKLDSDQYAGFEAVCSAVTNKQFDKHILITGLAGSGKSTLLKLSIFWLIQAGIPVSVTAHTNRAANKLKDDLSNVCHVTTTGKLFGFSVDEYGHIKNLGRRPKFSPGQVIFIDECGMQDGEVSKYIIDIAGWCKCLLVMAGDPCQLPHVKNRRYMPSPIFDSDKFMKFQLQNSYRQSNAGEKSLYELSSAIRSAVDSGEFIDFSLFSCVEVKKTPSSFISAAADRFRGGEDAKVITLSESQTQLDGLNRHIKGKVMPGKGKSTFRPEELLITLADMRSGDVFIAKDTDLIVESVSDSRISELGIVVNDYVCRSLIDGQRVEISAALDIQAALSKYRSLTKELRAAEDADDTLRTNTARKSLYDFQRVAAPVTSAYAVSVFSAQGSQYDHVFLDFSGLRKNFDRKLLMRMVYVAVSRAKKSLTITGSLPPSN